MIKIKEIARVVGANVEGLSRDILEREVNSFSTDTRTIATMSEWQNVEFYIKEFNLARWFDLDKIVYSNGKIKGKPDPEIYEIACRNLGLLPQDCIVIEDAVSGIESAHRANIGKIIAIASLESHELYKQFDYLYQIIDGFEEFDKLLFRGVNI